MSQRYMLIAWPADHGEDLEQVACDIQDLLDGSQCGLPEVIFPLSDSFHDMCEEFDTDLNGSPE